MNGFEFQEPGEIVREYINPEQCAGQLLIIWPIQHVNPAPPTKFSRPDKVDDAISVDVVTLDQFDESGTPKLFRAQLWRQSRLIQSFRQRIGQGPLLGTIGKGTATMGQPPWIFISLTHDVTAVQRANVWGAANDGFTPSEPRDYVIEARQPQVQQPGGYQPGGYSPQGQQPQYSNQGSYGGYQQQQNPQSYGGYQQPAHHGAPEAMPPWAQPQPQPQQYPVPPAQQPQQYPQPTPPLPPQQYPPQQQQGANPAQQSILERLAAQHTNNAQQQPQQQDEQQARQQYGY